MGRLATSGGRGQPDVIGVAKKAASYVVHIVECKLLGSGRHKFVETLSQLEGWKEYGERLWAAFPEQDWKKVDRRVRESFESQLREKDFGLVLSDGKNSRIELEAGRNDTVDRKKKQDLLERMHIDFPDEPIPVFRLDRLTAHDAAAAAAWCHDLLTVEGLEATGLKGKSPSPTYDHEHHPFFWEGWYRNDSLGICGDPFGIFVGDGRPSIVIWRHLENIDQLRRQKAWMLGAYVYALKPDDTFRVSPLLDLDLEEWQESETGSDLWLFWPVRIEGRTPSGVGLDLARLWKRVKKGKV